MINMKTRDMNSREQFSFIFLFRVNVLLSQRDYNSCEIDNQTSRTNVQCNFDNCSILSLL